jgi:excisionase family DNA binding protein
VATKDRMTFEEASKELQISEDELEQLVANGEIASIKEGDTFFFKKEVIAQWKKSRKTEPTIILADEDMEILDVMDEINLDAPPAASREKPAAPARPEAAAGSELNLDDLEMPDQKPEEVAIVPRAASGKKPAPEPEAASPDDTVLNLDGLLEDDGSEGTTPIPGAQVAQRAVEESSDLTVEGTVSDDTLLDTDLLEMGEEEDSFKLDTTADESVTEPTEASLLRGGGARAMQMKRKKSHAPFTVFLVLTVLALICPLGITLNTLFVTALGHDNVVAQGEKEPVYEWKEWIPGFVPGTVEWVADFFGG